MPRSRGMKIMAMWQLESDEVAIVIDVDSEYDFKLKNPRELVSAWTYRKFYEYVPVDPQACPPASPKGQRNQRDPKCTHGN